MKRAVQSSTSALLTLALSAGCLGVAAADSPETAYAAQKEGWVASGSSWWYAYEGGGYATGWEKINDQWFLFDNSGWMLTGWQKIGKTWYYLKASGAMKTGWQKLGSTWYYLESSGAMVSGWYKVDNTWYLFDSSGAMLTGWQKVGSAWYYLNASGAMLTGWQYIDDHWYYFDGSGAMAANRWQGNYYLTASGAMACSQYVGNYWVGSDGEWIPNYVSDETVYHEAVSKANQYMKSEQSNHGCLSPVHEWYHICPSDLKSLLMSRDGYSEKVAMFAIENCAADWDEAAYDHTATWNPLLKKSLPDYLKDHGFTDKQARHGAQKYAIDAANSELDHAGYISKAELVSLLLGRWGLDESLATYAADNCGIE